MGEKEGGRKERAEGDADAGTVEVRGRGGGEGEEGVRWGEEGGGDGEGKGEWVWSPLGSGTGSSFEGYTAVKPSTSIGVGEEGEAGKGLSGEGEGDRERRGWREGGERVGEDGKGVTMGLGCEGGGDGLRRTEASSSVMDDMRGERREADRSSAEGGRGAGRGLGDAAQPSPPSAKLAAAGHSERAHAVAASAPARMAAAMREGRHPLKRSCDGPEREAAQAGASRVWGRWWGGGDALQEGVGVDVTGSGAR